MNFVFVFAFIFKRTLDALLLSDRNHQTIHEQFRFILIFNRRNNVNFIFRFDSFSFRLLRSSDRNVNCFFEKFILNSDTFCFENIKQFFILDFSEIKSSFRCLCSLLKLNQEISKSSHFRVDNIRAMICNMINRNNHVTNATLLFNLFAHASDTTNVFY